MLVFTQVNKFPTVYNIAYIQTIKFRYPDLRLNPSLVTNELCFEPRLIPKSGGIIHIQWSSQYWEWINRHILECQHRTDCRDCNANSFLQPIQSCKNLHFGFHVLLASQQTVLLKIIKRSLREILNIW